jgi:hypothetical protein
MRKLLPVLLLAAMWLQAVTPPKVTTVTVHVVNDLGKPIPGAEVIIRFYDGHNIALMKVKRSWELRSSQDGTAKIPAIPQGRIQVQVYAHNYQTFGEFYEVHQEEKTVEVQLKLPQAQYSSHEAVPPAK